MRILVKDVDVAAGGGVGVSFVSLAGDGVATWRGSVPPVPGRRYDIEPDLPFVLDKNTMCQTSDDPTPRLQAKREGTVLRALVEGVEEDDVIYLRLAADCLFMVETAGGFVEGEVIQIVLSPEQLVLTLTGVVAS